MANICDNIYSTYNALVINIAWFVEEVFIDFNNIRKELESAYNENPNEMHLVSDISFKKPDYSADEKEEYIGDEDWLEPWDKV